MSKLRIIHITGVRELGVGQRKQLEYERKSASVISDVEWDTLAIHSGDVLNNFELKTPKSFDFLFIRNIYFWLVVIRKSKEYDLVLFRHITFDPFVFLFAPLIKNRISVHHSKEIEELKLIRKGWKGICSSNLERFSGRFSLKRVLCIVGVTNEISLYENERKGVFKKTIVYPNGIDVESIDVASDNRDQNTINIIFICSHFTKWHGLDLLLDNITEINGLKDFNIHLIGHLTYKQINDINNNRYSSNIQCYGSLNYIQYLDIVSKCDIALGSLAMFRQGLTEGSTLKVREMLAMGVAVYSGHKDAAIDDGFQYYCCDESFDFNKLIAFARKNKEYSRDTIRQASIKYIDKRNIMKNFIRCVEKMELL